MIFTQPSKYFSILNGSYMILFMFHTIEYNNYSTDKISEPMTFTTVGRQGTIIQDYYASPITRQDNPV